MLSIFVHCNDLREWLWQASESSDPFIQPEMREYTGFTAAVRYSPMPSMVLSPNDVAVQPFLNCIRKPDEHISDMQRKEKMEFFIQSLRKKIPVCLSQNTSLQDEPICVFIHFGKGPKQ